MTPQEMWNAYKQINPSIGDEIDAWAFGVEPDLLAICIVEIIKVSVQPFHQVSADHAYKEGEGDKSLAYWRQVHEDFFKDCFGEAGQAFTPDSKVVLEEFRKVYPL